MLRRIQIGPIVASLTLLAACSTSGAYLKPEKEQNLEQSVTSAGQLEQALGIPSLTIPREDGKIMWVYDGIHKSAGVTTYIPYLNLLAGYNNKNCTRLTVLVDRDMGKLSDWHYSSSKDVEYWAKTDDKCQPGVKDDAKPAK